MSTTLTNGLKLPDKGSVDWYSDMQNNYTILDGAVGTVAAHTSQIAGKAPAVHTHIKADITDFPAYGNTAGTICEGNDSRLSDARTPVAHTHTKSDVTDLLNSNFIPSANNSYDLGSSSSQWNNVYSKGYYYNGVAWGLDKANVWTGSNQFNASVKFSGQTGINWARGGTVGTLPSSVLYYGFQNALDSNDNVFDRIRSYVSTTGTNLQEHIKYAWNDLTKYATINYWINADGSDSEYKLSVKRVIPGSSNETDLGTSTNKWKSLNGINPGALSLPDLSVSQNIDTNGWVYNGTTLNSVLLNTGDTVVTKNGWLYVRTNNTVAGDRLAVRLNNEFAEYPTAIVGEIGFGHIEIFVPLVAGYKAYVFSNKAPTYIKFYPCLGNVPSGV